ncbi:MAG: DUF6502 family protein [Pseudohongiellaceae bacterium]
MSQKSPPTAGQPPEILVRAIRKLLRPLVRLMLSYQITYPMLISLLKSLYVEVADEEFGVDGKRSSDSRINLLTGVHRKDIKRLRAELHEPNPVPANLSTGARLIAWWTGSETFRDASGAPAPLPLRSHLESGDGASFEDLVEQVCRQDIRPRVILDDWLHQGLVHMDEQQRVVLDTMAFMPEDGFDEKAFFFGKNLHDHISASTHNLLGRKPPLFDRSVYYDRLSAQSVEELTQLASETGMQALQTINRRALALQQRDANADNSDRNERSTDSSHTNTNQYRMNFGIFHYNTPYGDRVITARNNDKSTDADA